MDDFHRPPLCSGRGRLSTLEFLGGSVQHAMPLGVLAGLDRWLSLVMSRGNLVLDRLA